MSDQINYEAFEREKAQLRRDLDARKVSIQFFNEAMREIDEEIEDLRRELFGYDGYTRGLL
ncbi:MAG: hypothetical protein ACR2OV_15955 [Hyphomicrobiaceae bacterium]